MKEISAVQARALTLDEFLDAVHAAGMEPGRTARFLVESPCGCVSEYLLTLQDGNTTNCMNRTRTTEELN